MAAPAVIAAGAFFNKYKVQIIIAVLIIAVAVTIYFWGKSSGDEYIPEDVDLPEDGQGGLFNPGKYTDLIWREVDGGVWNHDDDQISVIGGLSDSQLVAIYNDWNKRYASKRDNETLTAALRSESATPYKWAIIRDSIVERLEKYGAD